ncbi:MAG TPA: cytochrome C oxidase subunit IV family protein [Ramlibacter sp.]|uniref:cytochrome C oxidase subunit IV family protein n=1 Tax=Ramlibacter sp. TaxID=1917967 RepID=UPI002D7E720E|nr:cytochrome C oxidase subunit IV family protein [Ramlibacter sp.]HET8745023.1 cytochrome C oxidase subunit IV family protein [Ramlibacter sp.]
MEYAGHVEDIPPAREEPAAASHAKGHQQHPLGIYFKIWGLLFVLSTASYLVDYFHFQGMLRWSLIIIFMLLKAGLIVAVFMHMVWERLALVYAIIVPPLLLVTLVGIGVLEADTTFAARETFFAPPPPPAEKPAAH